MKKLTAQNIVKTLSVIGYIQVGLALLIGIFLLVGVIFPAKAPISTVDVNQGTAAAGTTLFTIVTIFVFIVALIILLVSWNLWNYKNWARIVLIVLCALGVIQGITLLWASAIAGIVNIIVYAFVLYLVAFNKDIVALFKEQQAAQPKTATTKQAAAKAKSKKKASKKKN